MGRGTSWEEVGDGNWTSSGTGIKRVTDSVTGVWYDPSVGGDEAGEDEGGVGDEASCLWSISLAYDNSDVARCPQRHKPRLLASTWARSMVNSTSWLLI